MSCDSGFGKHVIFCTDRSLSMHHDLNKKDILILSKGPTHRLDDTTLTSEKECSMNFIEEKKIFV